MNKTSQIASRCCSLGLLGLLCLVSACSTSGHRAPVVDRGNDGARGGADEARERDPNVYTVKKGDTLLRIALEFGQNYRDLVLWNNLSNPNDIKVDQVLRVTPPDAGGANAANTAATNTPGVQTSAVLMPPSDSRSGAASAQPSATGSAVPKRATPRGDKRPYSDANLAELQRPDGAPAGKPEARPAEPASANPPAVVAPVPPTAAQSAPAQAQPDEDKLSWMWPSEGKIIATFDEGKNKGIDIAGKAGQQVMAAGSGKVMYAGSGIRGYGNLVIVKHSNSLLSAYAHNRSILVKEGQSVNKGQMIAEMGDSDADGVKLHFEIRQQGKPVDPSKFLPNR
ncbi:MAG: peptidoglycan DD-metalloendopeptidase family protein [Pseudomonadota bacterium]